MTKKGFGAASTVDDGSEAKRGARRCLLSAQGFTNVARRDGGIRGLGEYGDGRDGA